MERYDPEWKDLAPRDVVRAQHPLRDLPARRPERLPRPALLHPARAHPRRVPGMYKGCLEYGIDITRDLLPVCRRRTTRAAASGWTTSPQHRRAPLRGGRVSCTGPARRQPLASTSLLEGLVWGHRSRSTSRPSSPRRTARATRTSLAAHRPRGARPGADRAGHEFDQAHHVELRRAGAHHAATRARHPGLRNLEVEIERFYRAAMTDELIGLRNAVRVALIVTLAAWRLRESRAHYRK